MLRFAGLGPVCLVAALALGAVVPAVGGAAEVRGSDALLQSSDVFGMQAVKVPHGTAARWLSVLGSGRVMASRQAVLVGRGGGGVRVLQRVLLARTDAQTARLRRELGRVHRLPLDAKALGTSLTKARRARRLVWADGNVAGQLVFLGPSGLARRTLPSLLSEIRGKLHRRRALTVWQELVENGQASRSVSTHMALEAFSIAISLLPGVKIPRGPVGTVEDGTLALRWLVEHLGQLRGAQRSAALAALAAHHPAPTGAHDAATQWTPSPLYQQMAEEARARLEPLMEIPLTVPMEVGTGPTQDQTALADTGVYGPGHTYSGPATSCVITVSRKGEQTDETQQAQTIAHEVFHCFQGEIVGVERFWSESPPDWLIEGGAEWAGCRLVPSAVTGAGGFTDAYLAFPQIPLFKRRYSAIGFFDLAASGGADVFARMADALRGDGGQGSVEALTGGLFSFVLDAWGPSASQDPPRGQDWTENGLCLPVDAKAPLQNATIADGTSRGGDTPAWTTKTARLFDTAFATRITGKGLNRLNDKAGVDEKNVRDETFCTQSVCRCPAGTEQIKPLPTRVLSSGEGEALLALTGGPDGSSAGIIGLGSNHFCKKKPKKSKKPKGKGPVGRHHRVGNGGVGTDDGDVHIATPDGFDYNFNVAGEYVVARSSTGDFEVQARQQPWLGSKVASINTALAFRIAGHRVGVYAGRRHGVSTLIDGHPIGHASSISLGSGASLTLGSKAIDRTITLAWPDGSTAEVLVYTVDTTSGLALALAPSTARAGHLAGLMGNSDGSSLNDDALPSGQPAQGSLYGQFARSWHVTSRDTLFDYPPGKGPHSYDRAGFPASVPDVGNLLARIYRSARQQCLKVHVTTQPYLRDCIFDLGFTRHLAFAHTTSRTVSAVHALSKSRTHFVSFAGIPDGTVITNQTAAEGATFGTAAQLGFNGPLPSHFCDQPPTASGGAALGALCDVGSGATESGVLIRLTSPATEASVLVGTTQATGGGYPIDIAALDRNGHQLAVNAVLVASTSFGDPRTGPVHDLDVRTDPNQSARIAFILINVDISSFTGSRLVFNNLTYDIEQPTH